MFITFLAIYTLDMHYAIINTLNIYVAIYIFGIGFVLLLNRIPIQGNHVCM